VKFLRTTDITKGPINWANVPYCEEAPTDMDAYGLKPRDILISRAGSVGFSALIEEVKEPSVFASYLIRFVPAREMDARYIASFLRSPDYWSQIGEASAGIALANVNASKLAEVELPLAPLAEQKRIADKLEAVLGRVDACRARLDRVPDLLKRFRQSVLAAATSGQLTEHWREGMQGISQPTEVTIGDVCNITSGFGFPKHLQGKESGRYPFAKVSDISRAVSEASGKLGDAVNYVDDCDLKELKAKAVPKGSTVFAKIGEAVRLNRRALTTRSLIIDNNCMALTPDTKRVLPEFVFLFMQTVDLSPFAVATTVPSVRRGDVESIEVSLFPLPEQVEIVRRVEALFAMADRIEARLTAARAQVERLTPATLSKAFRGDLVPQDPNDEPASKLLERLQSAPLPKPSRKR
jgi:type I restriction enzyme S subunit